MRFWRRNTPALLVLTIRNSAISAELFDTAGDTSSPYYETWHTIQISDGSRPHEATLSALKRTTATLIRNATKASVQEGKKRYVAAVTICIGAPSVVTVARSGHMRFEEPTGITEDHIKSINFEIRQSALSALRERTSQALSLIAAHTTHTFVNGYATHTPVGNYATHIEITRQLSIVDAAFLDALTTHCEDTFKEATVTVTPLLEMVSRRIRDAYHYKESIVAAVDTHATELATLNEYTIRDISTASTGIGDITTNTADYFNVSPYVVESMLSTKAGAYEQEIQNYVTDALSSYLRPLFHDITPKTQSETHTLFIHSPTRYQEIMVGVLRECATKEGLGRTEPISCITLPYTTYVPVDN